MPRASRSAAVCWRRRTTAARRPRHGRVSNGAARWPSSRWLDCRSWRLRSIFRSALRNSVIFRLPSAPIRRSSRSRSIVWWRRSKRTLPKIQPTAADGTCWRRCWRGWAATTKRQKPIAIRSLITATVPSSGPISAKPSPAPPEASSPRRPKPNSSARSP